MARTRFVVFALAMLATCALAEETRVNPVSNAAAGAVGLATAPIISGLTSISGDAAQVITANTLLAGESVGRAKLAAGKLVGGLLSHSFDSHRTAGRLLVEIVNAINSLNIAGINLAAGVTNSALSGIVGKIRSEAIAIGDIYTELLGEFGRFVGGSVNAVNVLKKGVFVSPLVLKVSSLEHALKSLITFLESALSPSVATPLTAAAWAPHIATLKAVKTLLSALKAAMEGPLGIVGGAVDVATDAANDVLGFATGGAANVNGLAGLVQTGLNLLGNIPGL